MPVVTSVTTDTANGTYGVGEHIVLQVHFSHRVWVKDGPVLPYLEVATDGVAHYVGGNNTHTLEFEYVVKEGDNVAALDYRDTRTWKRQNFSYALQRPPAAGIKVRLAFNAVLHSRVIIERSAVCC
jgi:hypothetical protein